MQFLAVQFDFSPWYS